MTRSGLTAFLLLPSLCIGLFTGLFIGGVLRGDDPQEDIVDGLVYVRSQQNGVVVNILKVTLKQKDLYVRSLKATGTETLGAMVERLNDQGERVIGAINGDFFRRQSKAGVPHGVQVADGKLIFGPRKRSMICFGPKKTPYIAVVGLKGEVRVGGSRPRSYRIDAVNAFPNEFKKRDGVLLYTPAFQELAASRYLGLVAAVEKIDPALQVGDQCRGRVARVERGGGGAEVAVPADGCLLYFLGKYARELHGRLKKGVDIRLKLSLPPIKGGVPQAIGGGPRLVRKGRVNVEFGKEDFDRLHMSHLNNARHPRSAVGYDRAKKYLFLVMVEGRHEESRGMTMGELGKYMKGLGCYDAMAFDGGGSAAMYVLGKGIASRSNEEREIANSLIISTKRPDLVRDPDPGEPAPPDDSEPPKRPDLPKRPGDDNSR